MNRFLGKIFSKRPKTVEEDSTPEAHLEAASETNNLPSQTVHFQTKNRFEPTQLIVGCLQSVGMQRSHNEDSIFCMNTAMTSEGNNMPFGLFIVADGMGGHQHGEIASSIAVRALSGYVLNKLCNPIFSYKSTPPSNSIQEIMSEGILDAHRIILKEVQGGGTTLSAALLRGEQMTIAHVGDSRVYSISANGEIQILTRDHSLVKRLIELGQITEEESINHPQRNVLYRALGQGEPFEPDVSTYPIVPGGYLLICSDGLWGVVPEEVLVKTIIEATSPHEACQLLVDAANKGGGPDNISVILIYFPA